MRRINAAGIAMIRTKESLRLEAYKPLPNDRWTIGWGHTRGVVEGMRISAEQAEELFQADLASFSAEVDRVVRVKVSSNQFSALVVLTYNIGLTSLVKSDLLPKLNDGDYLGAAAEFVTFVHDKSGTFIRGLLIRRELEQKLFLTPDDVSAAA